MYLNCIPGLIEMTSSSNYSAVPYKWHRGDVTARHRATAPAHRLAHSGPFIAPLASVARASLNIINDNIIVKWSEVPNGIVKE